MKKPWRTPRNQSHQGGQAPRVIQPGDSGIWATCNKGRERACVGELRDLFTEYAELLYGSGGPTIGSEEATKDAAEDDEVSGGIEDEINAEVAGLKQPVGAAQLFTPIRVDVQCGVYIANLPLSRPHGTDIDVWIRAVVFFKTAAPVEPVSFVQRICEDALNRSRHKRTRYAKRLSPMTLMGRASMEGLEKLAKAVLEPHFHLSPFQPRKVSGRVMHGGIEGGGADSYRGSLLFVLRCGITISSRETRRYSLLPSALDQGTRWI